MLPVLGIILMIGFFVAQPIIKRALLVRRSWISGPPFEVVPLDIASFPPKARDRFEQVTAEFAELGYQSLGACQFKANNNLTRGWSVWIRDGIVAEVVIVQQTSPRLQGITIAFGQEYMDGTAIVIRNSPRIDTLSENHQTFFLAGLKNLSILEQISRAIIDRNRNNRLPWTPANASEYKLRDLTLSVEILVNQKLFKFDPRSNRYRPTFKYLCRSIEKASKKPNALGHTHTLADDYAITNRWLKEFGYPTLSQLNAKIKAFPVITNEPQESS